MATHYTITVMGITKPASRLKDNREVQLKIDNTRLGSSTTPNSSQCLIYFGHPAHTECLSLVKNEMNTCMAMKCKKEPTNVLMTCFLTAFNEPNSSVDVFAIPWCGALDCYLEIREVTTFSPGVPLAATRPGLPSPVLAYNSSKVGPSIGDPTLDFHFCGNCYAGQKLDAPESMKRCAACKKLSYCNLACQKKHWPLHKEFCALFKEVPPK